MYKNHYFENTSVGIIVIISVVTNFINVVVADRSNSCTDYEFSCSIFVHTMDIYSHR